jgi:hypothetical protein
VSIGPNCNNSAEDIDAAKPFDVLCRKTIEQDRIEAAWWLANEADEIMLRRESKAPTLRRGDAFRRAAEGLAATQPDLDEDQGLAITDDEIDLASAAAIVAAHDDESAGGQESRRKRLGIRAAVHCGPGSSRLWPS